MDRRHFLQTLVGGLAAGAAIRTWPFRVYSFPTEIQTIPLYGPAGGLPLSNAEAYVTATMERAFIQLRDQLDRDMVRAWLNQESLMELVKSNEPLRIVSRIK
jgi:hypothetical protein